MEKTRTSYTFKKVTKDGRLVPVERLAKVIMFPADQITCRRTEPRTVTMEQLMQTPEDSAKITMITHRRMVFSYANLYILPWVLYNLSKEYFEGV